MPRSTHGGRHELGQNFLVHGPTLEKIAAIVAATQGPILEIGSGSGALTRHLARLQRPLTAIDIDEHRFRAELDDAGSGFVRRIWHEQCVEQRTSRAFSITYGDRWRLIGVGRQARLVGHFSMIRGESTKRVVVSEILGSVLLDLHLPRPGVLPSGVRRRDFPLVMMPARCDPHALIESSRTFDFTVSVTIGRADPVSVLRTPDTATRQRAQALLDAACR